MFPVGVQRPFSRGVKADRGGGTRTRVVSSCCSVGEMGQAHTGRITADWRRFDAHAGVPFHFRTRKASLSHTLEPSPCGAREKSWAHAICGVQCVICIRQTCRVSQIPHHHHNVAVCWERRLWPMRAGPPSSTLTRIQHPAPSSLLETTRTLVGGHETASGWYSSCALEASV